MGTFSFLRRPTKLILYSALLFLTTTAALIFVLQYVLDGIVMDNFVSNYAYVGTVYSRIQETPFLEELPEEIIEKLVESENVAQSDVRKTYSAKAEELKNVPDTFMTIFTMNNFVFVEGIVSEKPELQEEGIGITEYAKVDIIKTWAGNTGDHQRVTTRIVRDAGTWIPELREGDHIFFVGMYSTPGGKQTANNNFYLYQMEEFERYGIGNVQESSLIKHSLTVLPEGLTDLEAETYILDFMEQTGLYEYCQLVNEMQDVFTVRAVSDMGLLLANVEGKLFLTEGRELKSTDIGTKVCVIDQAVADANGLKVGDSISLALAEDCYVSKANYEVWRGWESGYPEEKEAYILEYGEACEYEIVGIYSDAQRNIQTGYFQYSKNDIFIPKQEAATVARPYSFSFRVLGPDYESFMNEMEVALFEQGYTLNVLDAGWESVQEAYYAMEGRRSFLLGCAIAAFLAAILSFDCLLTAHFRYEYGLCRLLGAYRKEAEGSVWTAFGVLALPAGILSVLVSFLTYEFGLKNQMGEYLSVTTFSRVDCIGMLILGTMMELVIAGLVQKILIRRMEKGSLLRLLK